MRPEGVVLLLLALLMYAVGAYVLFLVVRAGVEAGIRRTVSPSLLRPTEWDLVQRRKQEREQQGG